MAVSLPLDKMTTAEKLEVMDRIWSDLREQPKSVPAPCWHEDVLRARQARLNAGETTLSDWDAAKARLRKFKA